MKKNYLSLLLVGTFILFSTAASAQQLTGMQAHNKAGVTCLQCHGTAKPTAAPDQQQCLTCHANSQGQYRGSKLDKDGYGVPEAYMESGRTRMAAIHDSHSGPVRCTTCHAAHQPAPKMYCNHCHSFDVKAK